MDTVVKDCFDEALKRNFNMRKIGLITSIQRIADKLTYLGTING